MYNIRRRNRVIYIYQMCVIEEKAVNMAAMIFCEKIGRSINHLRLIHKGLQTIKVY